LRSFSQKVILIAGGYDKKIPFDDLGPVIANHVKALCLTGDTAQKIRTAVETAPNYQPGAPTISHYDDFRTAVLAACGMAQPGDIVILSPACASFDKFKNFMERGNAFKQIISAL
ncbi:MAG: UDP-N-acetylmuramoyl-L-alanine--D-glutamate ligase, partial [Oscillospiraceae bacterium]